MSPKGRPKELPECRVIHVLIPYEDYTKLMEIARREHESLSALMREAITGYLNAARVD